MDFARTQDVPYLIFYDKNLDHIATFNTEYPTFPPIQEWSFEPFIIIKTYLWEWAYN